MNPKVKICHLTSINPSDDIRIFHKQCSSLAKAGYETYLVCHGESFVKNDVNVVGLGLRPSSRLKRFFSFSRQVYKKALEIDAEVYHIHNPDLLPFGMKLKRKGKIVVFDSHEHFFESIKASAWIPRPFRWALATVYGIIEKKVCSKIDAVVYVTPTQRDKFDSYGVKTQLITNFPIIEDDSETALRTSNRKLCFAGGISPEWMHENIIPVLEECDATYELAGTVLEGYLNELKALTGWERVNFMGRIPFDEVSPMLQGCAVGMALLKPSGNTAGNMGTLGNNKFFEFMQNGLPIICTDFALWKEIIDTDKCGIYVNPDSKEDIVRAILYLLDNPQKANEIGKNGRKAVMEKYNWSTQEEKLLELYRGFITKG